MPRLLASNGLLVGVFLKFMKLSFFTLKWGESMGINFGVIHESIDSLL